MRKCLSSKTGKNCSSTGSDGGGGSDGNGLVHVGAFSQTEERTRSRLAFSRIALGLPISPSRYIWLACGGGICTDGWVDGWMDGCVMAVLTGLDPTSLDRVRPVVGEV